VELGRVKRNEGGALANPISDANADRYVRSAKELLVSIICDQYLHFVVAIEALAYLLQR
jgi:hypothetical protein